MCEMHARMTNHLIGSVMIEDDGHVNPENLIRESMEDHFVKKEDHVGNMDNRVNIVDKGKGQQNKKKRV